MKLTEQQREVLIDSLTALNEKIDEKINTIKKFKWLCSAYLPQSSVEYEKNINVFDIGDKTVKDLESQKEFARNTIWEIFVPLYYNQKQFLLKIKSHNTMPRTKNLSKKFAHLVEDKFPNFDKSGSIKGMKELYYGKNALLVRCGNFIYNVTSEPNIYHEIAD